MDSEESTPVSRTNSTTVVINGVVFSLSPNNNESEKSDFAPEKFDVTSDTGLIGGDPVMPAFVVEKGLVLSVSDDISSSSQEPLGVSTTAVDLRHLHSAVTAQFLAQAGLQADGASSQLLHTPEGSLDEAAGLTSSANHEELSLVGDSTLESVNIKLEPSEHCRNRGGEEELKKKKGGWPKGKKRKKERETNVPKAPVTAYVLFAMERRQTIRETNPDLPFPSVTKILGNEWSAMTADEKQKYVDEAEADKKRYIEELKAYQRSEAYQEFLKKKKVKNSTGNQILGRIDPAAECVEEGLFCEVCDMYFMSHHNRKEHMFGKQHLQNVTKEFEEEQMKQASQVRAQNDPLAADLSQDIFNNSESDQSLLDNMSGGRDSSLLYIQDFIQNFLRKNYDRELEIVELRKSVEIARQKNAEFLTKAEEARVFQTKLEQHVGMLRAYGAALATQIDQLRMVPTLFGVINF